MPRHIWDFKLAVLGLLMSALYELELATQLPTAWRVAAFVLGSALTVTVLSWLLSLTFRRSEWVRRVLFSRSWVEGVWHLQTLAPGIDRPVAEGIATFRYVGDELRPDIDIETPPGTATSIPTVTKSILASVGDDDLSYTNVFSYTVDAESKQGIALGSFRMEDRPYPTLYDGRYILFDETAYKRQIGSRIEPRTVRRFKKKHGASWKVHLLRAKASGDA